VTADSEALSFLEAVTGFHRSSSRSSADRPVRLAVIDPAYNPWSGYPDAPPPARVTFEGESVLSTKAYGYAGGFIPWAGMRVFLVPIGNTYIIGGAINTQTPQGFWANAAGTESGVEFGGGSFFDTDEGLVIAGDASISGDLTVAGGKALGRGVVMVNVSTANSGTYTTTLTNIANLNGLVLKPGRAYRISHGPGVQHNTAATYADFRLQRTSGTAATLWEFYRYPVPTANVITAVQGEAYISNTSAGNITLDIQLQAAASAGTGYHAGAATRRRYIMAEDVGLATDYPMAYPLTS
jgi:hypothetical protein